MRHICRRLDADRLPLWRSPAWEMQVVWRHLCISAVISDTRMASAFLNGHRPVPECTQLPLYMQQHGHHTAPLQTARFSEKKVVRNCEFSEKFGILEKHHTSNDAPENA
jgi:hypothetical protein